METLFAQVNTDGNVLNVIVIEKESIHILDQSFKYIQTWADADGIQKKKYNYARIGGKYSESDKAFIDPQPFNSWSLDSSFKWQPPIPMPADGKMYLWSEVSKSWIEATYV